MKKPSLHLSLEEVYLGEDCASYISTVLEKCTCSDIKILRCTCLNFYIKGTGEIQDRLPEGK